MKPSRAFPRHIWPVSFLLFAQAKYHELNVKVESSFLLTEDISRHCSSTNSESVSIVDLTDLKDSAAYLEDSEFPIGFMVIDIVGPSDDAYESAHVRATEALSVEKRGGPPDVIEDIELSSPDSCQHSPKIVENDSSFDGYAKIPHIEFGGIEFDHLTSNSPHTTSGRLNMNMASSLSILLLIYLAMRMAVQVLRNWSEINFSSTADNEMSMKIVDRQDQDREREIADLRSKLEIAMNDSIRYSLATRMVEEKASAEIKILRDRVDEIERIKTENEKMLLLVKELTDEKRDVTELRSAQEVRASQLLECTKERDRLAILVMELNKEKEKEKECAANLRLKQEEEEKDESFRSLKKKSLLFENGCTENEEEDGDDDSDFENFYFSPHSRVTGINPMHYGGAPRWKQPNQNIGNKFPVVRSVRGSFSTAFTDSSSLRNDSCSSCFSESEEDHNNYHDNGNDNHDFEDMNDLEFERELMQEEEEDKDFETEYQKAMRNIVEKLALDLSAADKLASSLKTPTKENRRELVILEHTKVPSLVNLNSEESEQFTNFHTPEKAWKQSLSSAFKYEKKKVVGENIRDCSRTHPQERALIEGHLIGQNKNLMGQICDRDEEIKESLHRIDVLNTRLEYAVLAAKSANLEVARLKCSSPNTTIISDGTPHSIPHSLTYDFIPTPCNKEIDLWNLFTTEEKIAVKKGMNPSRVFSPLDDIPPYSPSPCTPAPPLYLYLAGAGTTPSTGCKTESESPSSSLGDSCVGSEGETLDCRFGTQWK
jgi:hypothetical protein